MRLVLDTNVVVAGLLWVGTPRRLLDRAIDEGCTLFSSPTLIDELAQTLHYKKFAQRIGRFGTTPLALVAQYSALVTLVSPTQVPRVIERDIDDDQVIAAAVAAQAELIVSGDRKHLLPLGSHAGIGIVNAAEALRRIEAHTQT
jgi:putative PIN family toxin of toxin-antitoxin system